MVAMRRDGLLVFGVVITPFPRRQDSEYAPWGLYPYVQYGALPHSRARELNALDQVTTVH